MKKQPSHRMERVGELLREEIANLLLFEVKDPRVSGVNFTSVSVTKDLGVANVRWMIYAPDEELKRSREQATAGLNSVSSFLRREVGRRIRMRVTPELKFHWDSGLEHRRTIDDLLAEISTGGKAE